MRTWGGGGGVLAGATWGRLLTRRRRLRLLLPIRDYRCSFRRQAEREDSLRFQKTLGAGVSMYGKLARHRRRVI